VPTTGKSTAQFLSGRGDGSSRQGQGTARGKREKNYAHITRKE